jgi:hypothetical protein
LLGIRIECRHLELELLPFERIGVPVDAVAAGHAAPHELRLAPDSPIAVCRIERLLVVGGMGDASRARDPT